MVIKVTKPEPSLQVEFIAIWGKVELDLDSYEYFVECNAA